jgi:5-methyltetrahydropteroyltriglutamate--homocysteine methyltransferase
LREVEDASVLKVLEMQRAAGLEIFTEGEYRRAAWSAAVRESLDGVVEVPMPARPILGVWQGPSGELASAVSSSLSFAAGARLRKVRRFNGVEAAFLRDHAPGAWKVTMPGPLSAGLPLWRAGVTDRFYATRQELIDDVAAMLREEIEAVIDEGASYIQLDSLHYVERIAYPTMRAQMIEDGEDPEAYLDALIEADNSVLAAARDRGVLVAMHMCRGNNRSAWHAEGSYEAVAEKAFNRLKVDRFLLEYDTDRAGGFEPLRFMPRDKTVVLGLISSKDPALESIDNLRRRIDEAAKYVPFENLAISPQCGFASTAPGNLLTWDEQRLKLELVVETAQRVWG